MGLLDSAHSKGSTNGGDLLTALLQGGIDMPIDSHPQVPELSETHVLTYATHDAGMFDTLVNNEHGVAITVLGWKQPWKDYRDRWHAYREEIVRRGRPEDVYILCDSFDVKVLKSLDKAREAFDALKARLVVSEATWQNIVARRMYVATAQTETPFNLGRREDSIIACAGLVMGYGKELATLAAMITQSRCTDDQRTLNSVLPFIAGAVIDTDHKIFRTLKSPMMPIPPDVSFVHYPGVFGQLTPARVFRSFQEYSQYFVGDFAIVFLFATFILLMLERMHLLSPGLAHAVQPVEPCQSCSPLYVSGCGCFAIMLYFLVGNKS